MAKTGSQVHAILACVKYRKDQGYTLRSRELFRLWPHIGMSTLPNLISDSRISYRKRSNVPFLKRIEYGIYTITKAGEAELKRLGPYLIEYWNPNAPPGTPLPWEFAGEVLQKPEPIDTTIISTFLQDQPRFYLEKKDKNDWKTSKSCCKNPACTNKRQDVKYLYQDPHGETAVLRITVHTCNLCKNEVLAGMEDVLAGDVPELDC
jgi:hypothetical protein